MSIDNDHGAIKPMPKLDEIEDAIRALPPSDFAALRDWIAEYDALLWDRQFEEDVEAGRLDALAEEALADLCEGRCTNF